MPDFFGDRLDAAVRAKKSLVVTGIDPVLAKLPPALREKAGQGPAALNQALTEFGTGIIDAVADLVPAVKLNIAFFEAHGINGLSAYNAICAYARSAGLLVIGDSKRGDIGSTAAAYAQGHLLTGADVTGAEPLRPSTLKLGPHDALTLNPYLGGDGVKPFLETGLEKGQGFFVLVKTSNPSSRELQDLELKAGGTVAEAVARLVDQWGRGSAGASGLSAVGAVVGATHPEALARFRELLPQAPFLVPGYGAQGGTAADVVRACREDGSGVLVNASRSIIYAWETAAEPEDWQGAARRAAERMNADLAAALQEAGKRAPGESG